MIADEGHDVANHSYSHYKMSSLNSSAIKSEILNVTEYEENHGKRCGTVQTTLWRLQQ